MYTTYQTRVGAKSDIGVRSTVKNTHTNNIKDENGGMVDKVTPLNGTGKMRYGADTYRKGISSIIYLHLRIKSARSQ
ncbi:uncharacterized protein EAF02_000229 [Botrytis sinoallii]|uniref:uncharacterized protein n=1 Tax=Botrytis sinoallii TaxID=1463999 RepID=UPI001900EC80|nr:uncharacterized protein EAF02_000229 [Botrytis sinoallii]KAF7892691.1 hypothetical protein EAF02_000229 [Botrytis sinoallii]